MRPPYFFSQKIKVSDRPLTGLAMAVSLHSIYCLTPNSAAAPTLGRDIVYADYFA